MEDKIGRELIDIYRKNDLDDMYKTFDKLLTTRELALILRMPQTFFEDKRKSGHGPRFICFDTDNIYYQWSDVQQWLDSLKDTVEDYCEDEEEDYETGETPSEEDIIEPIEDEWTNDEDALNTEWENVYDVDKFNPPSKKITDNCPTSSSLILSSDFMNKYYSKSKNENKD